MSKSSGKDTQKTSAYLWRNVGIYKHHPAKTAPPGGGAGRLYVIGVRLEEQENTIDNPADAGQAECAEVQDTHASLALIEFVSAEIPEEQAEQERYPLILPLTTRDINTRGVVIIVIIVIVNNVIDNGRLLRGGLF